MHKNTKIIKGLSLLLVFVMLVSLVLTSCKDESVDDGNETTETTTSATDKEPDASVSGDKEVTLPEGHILISNKAQNVEVVYNKTSESLLETSAQRLYKSVYSLGAGKTELLYKAGDNESVKILVGNTGEQESTDALASLAPNTFSVKVLDKKIVIAASNAQLYDEAIDYFLSQCSCKLGQLSVSGSLSYTSTPYAEHTVLSAADKPTIVYAAGLSGGEALATRIKNAIASKTGVTLNVTSDAAAKSGAEILIGATNRALSSAKTADYINYRLEYDNATKTLVLTGNAEAGVAALERIISLAGKSNSLVISEAVCGQSAPAGYGFIPAYGGSPERVTYADEGSYYVLYRSQSSDKYKKYTESLDNFGMTKYASKEVNGNLFATYTDGYNVLNVSYLDYYKYVFISAETAETTALANTESTYVGEPVATNQLAQINGACAFIIRLSDGRFIVIDGGMPDRENGPRKIYDTLSNLAEGEKPVIAAWFLTHAHIDHVGGFVKFSENYANKVTLEQLVINFPAKEIYTQNKEGSSVTSEMETNIKNVKASLKKYSGAKAVIAHAGMELWYADTKVDMLYTHENLATGTMVNTNSSSLAFSVTVAGQKITFLGDAHNDTSEIIYRMYGNTLKTDVVQVAHHGYNGGHRLMYKAMAADVALWTSPYETVMTPVRPANPSICIWNNPENNFDINSVKENLMMNRNSVMILSLPHEIGSQPKFARTFS